MDRCTPPPTVRPIPAEVFAEPCVVYRSDWRAFGRNRAARREMVQDRERAALRAVYALAFTRGRVVADDLVVRWTRWVRRRAYFGCFGRPVYAWTRVVFACTDADRIEEVARCRTVK
jgi:hypothetical protein